MNIQRFIAPTSREALAKARMVFGDATVILFNRPTELGVEVVATAEDSLQELDNPAPRQAATTAPADTPEPASSYADVASKVEDDAAQLAMSTLSFQDYVRERMARKRQEATAAPPPSASAPELPPQPAAPIRTMPPAPAATPARNVPPPIATTHNAMAHDIAQELHAMKDLLEERFNVLTWLGHARHNPIQANLMLKLISAGYSPTLTRTILERMPHDANASAAVRWVVDVLERNLRTDAGGPALHEEGGIFALVGGTGVGKTTTAAKLAGLCARTYGPSSVGLITLDTYRVGAQEQLRAYGKMLGVVAHLAHDRAALQDLLGLLSNKKMVLIDTTGLAPRDPRKREMADLLDLPAIRRLLVLNAGAHGDTLDDMVHAFKGPGQNQVILSKVDEAVKLGTALDAAIRHQLMVRGVTTGQRVPEDWEAANAGKLIRASMRATGTSAFDPKVADVGFFFNPAATHTTGIGPFNA